MNIVKTILIKSLIKPFYSQHAGLFFFLFILMFGTVGYANGAGLFEYHVALIRGILKNPFFLLFILLIWLLYTCKTWQFIIQTFRKPENSFLQMLPLIKIRRLYWLLVWVEFMILLPVVFYAVLILIGGIYLHAYLPCLLILFFIVGISMLSGRLYLYILQNAGKSIKTLPGILAIKPQKKPYWHLFITYIWREKKLLFGSIKIYSCCILYALVVNLTLFEYDLSMIFLFFSFGILGHGLLIHQLRELEESRLAFYRTVSVSLFRRFIQYAILYFILLIPEMITILSLTPKYLHIQDAIIFILFSFSLLLFLNSLLFIQFFRMKAYLKIILCIFLFIFISVLTGSVPWLCLLLFLSAGTVFFKRYYLYEG